MNANTTEQTFLGGEIVELPNGDDGQVDPEQPYAEDGRVRVNTDDGLQLFDAEQLCGL